MDLVYKNEKTLFALMLVLVLSLVVWGSLLANAGMAVLGYALMFFLFYCFAQSALISYIKGTGVQISHGQFADLHEQITACCTKLGLARVPDAYLLQMGGSLNAFATRFLGRDFLVLYSDVVDNLHDNPDALNFYIGHEIGHIKRQHLAWATVLLPASFLPLVGAAYSRAREYTCDRHGLAACEHPVNAEFGLAVLAAGGKRWRTMNKGAFIDQSRETEGFWMSFHELVGDYPWLVKRMAAVRALAAGAELQQPRRHVLATLMALFVPRMGTGGGAGAIVALMVAGIVAAVAIPAYKEYRDKAAFTGTSAELRRLEQRNAQMEGEYSPDEEYKRNVSASAQVIGAQAAVKIGAYVTEKGSIPTLEQVGLSATPSNAVVRSLALDPNNAVLRVVTRLDGERGQGVLVFEPTIDENRHITWACKAENILPALVPRDCV